MIKYTIICLFVNLTSFAHAELEKTVQQVRAHLIIEDYQRAKDEAQAALVRFPDSSALYENYIRSLAALGQEKEMLAAWDAYIQKYPDKIDNRELIEEMSWGVLEKASSCPSLYIRLMSLLAAYFSHDTKGIQILHQGLNDSNSAIRAASVELSSHCRDDILQNEIRRLFKEETVWDVRKQVIKAIGSMKIKDLSDDLKALIASDQSLAEEKALAIEALIHLWHGAEREEIVQLTTSNRAGLRLLACRAISHFSSTENHDQLAILVRDSHPQVRAAALHALGLIRAPEASEMAKNGLQDLQPEVALSAAWLLTLYSPGEGQQALEPYLKHERKEIRLMAASALNGTGRYGLDLALRYFNTHPDPYVRLNLAMGMIGQRAEVQQAATVLNDVLSTEKERWCQVEEGLFHYVAPKNLIKSETTEAENQTIRLEILNMLALVDFPGTQEAIRRFLLEREWGITGMAAALLLTEGDDSAVDLVKELLHDDNKKVQVQAALILSLWSREESVIQILENNYATADKELKGKILEGIGRIGSIQSVPFLIKILKESSQHLRIIAATALIECLNH